MYEIDPPDDITIDASALHERVADAIKRSGGTLPDTFTFSRYALECWANDAAAVRGSFVKLQRWIAVVDKLAAANAHEKFRLEDQDWTTLKTVIEGGQVHYPPLIAIHLVAYPLAVLHAEKVDA